jgi:hypothetical protein
MYPEPFLHLRAAIKRGHKPDARDLHWLAQNPQYLTYLSDTEQTFAKQCLQTQASVS